MAVINYSPKQGVLGTRQGPSMTLAELAAKLSGQENALPTRGIGGVLGLVNQAANYDYPDTALGWASLPAKAVTGIAKGMMDVPREMIDDANNQVAGLSDGRKVTEGSLGLLGTSAVLPFRAPAGSIAMNVYQGGPHKYGPGDTKDSLKHIGKGEGAQAYGWGRYDAENKAVAEQYRKNLSYDQGVIYNDAPLGTRAALIDEVDADLPESVARLVANYATPDGVTKETLLAARNMVDGHVKRRAKELEILRSKTDERAAPLAMQKQEELARLEKIKQRVDGFSTSDFSTNKGSLYTHDLPDEDIARYLDWDAPLSEQPESVQLALGIKRDTARDAEITKRIGEINAEMKKKAPSKDASFDELFAGDNTDLGQLQIEKTALEAELSAPSGRPDLVKQAQNYGFYNEDPLGRELYQSFAMYGDPEKTSRMLARAGIPGLKYYDGMSRTDAVKPKPYGNYYQAQRPDGTGKLFKTKQEAQDYIDSNVGRTRNFVTWDQDVLNRMKMLERNGEKFEGLLKP
jgi:hypothetical protein